MNTCSVATTTRPHPSGCEVGGGRYQLEPGARGGPHQGPVPALDTRLVRRVLVQRGTRVTPSGRLAARLVRVEHPGIGPLLDAGDDAGPGGAWTAWTVFPAWSWRPFDAAAPDWSRLDLGAVARVAAWLTAAVVTAQTSLGATVAPRSGDVVVDPAVFDGTADADACPVRWLPSLAATDGDLATTLGALVHGRSKREERALAEAIAPVATPHGRPRAARTLAGLGGLDPAVLGLPLPAPHHAVTTTPRRPTGRRTLVGLVPTSKRAELTCESVEVCS